MYFGSVSLEAVERFLMGKWRTVSYVPALTKMIDEILDNSIDEAIRTQFQFANSIDVSINGNTVTITDNGRGIPHEEILDANNGDLISRPVAAWTKVNAGTSFDDDRVSIGANGLGSAATNFLSTTFEGRTWQNGKLMKVICSDGGDKVDVKVVSKSGHGTEVTFTPDFSFFEVDSLEEQDTLAILEDRLIGLQMAFPQVKFSFNKKRIQVRDLKTYASMFTDEGGSVVMAASENLSFFVVGSNDGFRPNCYVNGVNTRLGGAYVDFISNTIVEELVRLIKRKHKIEVAKSTIRSGLSFVVFAKNFQNPKFDSQTKERLTNSQGAVKEHFNAAGLKDLVFYAKKIFLSADIIDPIIASQLAKKLADETRDARLAQKKLKKVKVAKHIAANSPDATLFLTEGQSALGFLLKVRDPNMVGAYPLRGVVMNTWNMKAADVLKNKELGELISVLGLNINDPDSVDDLTYKNIGVLADADRDGEKIATLLVAFFAKFWPRLFTENRIKIVRSPIMISSKGKDTQWFYGYDAAAKFKDESKGYNHRYIKGLGSLDESEYDSMINNPVMDTIHLDDIQYLDMMFGASSEPRKVFMMEDVTKGV